LAVVINLCRAKGDRTADDMLCYFLEKEKKGEFKLKIPECAIDCHTKAGREKGLSGDKAEAHFFYEGSILKNESEHYNKKYSNALKEKYKAVWEEMSKHTT